MYHLLKPLLFLLDPEKAHKVTVKLLDAACAIPPVQFILQQMFCSGDESLATNVMGLRFPNPVGLAAGFDKDGKHISSLACLGFGFIEVGTVTPVAQDGNPLPRLFRLPADRALINRMGFNNEGLDALVARLKKWREQNRHTKLIIGGNIGKNKITPNEHAEKDYLTCFGALFPWIDYFVVNVSSPNTPGLRELQEKEPLTRLLLLLQEENRSKGNPKPILLKIAPDLTDSQLDDIADIVRSTGITGVIATNTTISRSNLKTPPGVTDMIGAGGLSGAPLKERSTQVIGRLRASMGHNSVIIGVGGIDDAESAREKLEAGANLVQVYSGLVYQGPAMVKNILQGIRPSVS